VTEPPDLPALRRYLERPELARLLAAARDKRERLGRLGGTVELAGAGDEERSAVAGLLGLPVLPPDPLRIRLERLDRALRESRFGVGLEEALEAAGGPLRDVPAQREAERRRWEQMWEQAARHPAIDRHPGLVRWLDELCDGGLVRRLGVAGEEELLLNDALDVLAALPGADGPPVRRAVLAHRVLGASHALDAGSPTSTLVLRALAVLARRPGSASAAERRRLWEEAGVIEDDVSSRVLVLNLRPAGGGATAAALRHLAAAGEPALLTLRQVTASLDFELGQEVRICENPVVLATAADRLGPDSAPLVCVEGQPTLAARRLLARLAAGGSRLLYHGDFDWAGLTIANGLFAELPCRPWRFTHREYLRAAGSGPGGLRLAGAPVTARWDPELAAAMAQAGAAVEEEAVLDDLLADLAASGR
jgi:uncharacterized protein (TIGR02679 family)